VVRLGKSRALISDGAALGGTTVILLVPEEQAASVALCNVTGGPTAEAAVAILKALLPGFDAAFGEAIAAIEAEIARPGVIPKGGYEGELRMGDGQGVSVQIDFDDPEVPVIQLGGQAATLQRIGWEHGTLTVEASGLPAVVEGSGKAERLSLTLWQEGEGLSGVALEARSDSRASFGVPYQVRLRAMR
jgi:hypothetical protein